MNAIELKLLRNAEYLQYVKDYLAILNLNNPQQLEIEAKLTDLTARTTELETL